MNNNGNYLIRKHKLNGIFCYDIEQENLIYADCSPTHHGLQCNHVSGTDEYEKIYKLCDQLNDIIREIDKLNNPNQI